MAPKHYERKDALYRKAKDEGFRSRAAYKLEELDAAFRLLRPGMRVLDVGAWPGGWLQVASRRIGPRGLAVGVDLVEIAGGLGPNVVTIVGDASDPGVLGAALERSGGPFDVVLSDMSPKLSGIAEADDAGCAACARLAADAARTAAKPGAPLVVKLFKGPGADEFVRSLRADYRTVKRIELKSTRGSSNEFYVVASGTAAGARNAAEG